MLRVPRCCVRRPHRDGCRRSTRALSARIPARRVLVAPTPCRRGPLRLRTDRTSRPKARCLFPEEGLPRSGPEPPVPLARARRVPVPCRPTGFPVRCRRTPPGWVFATTRPHLLHLVHGGALAGIPRHGRRRLRGDRSGFVQCPLSTPCPQVLPHLLRRVRRSMKGTVPLCPEVPHRIFPTAEGDGSGAAGPLDPTAADPQWSPVARPPPISQSQRTYRPGHGIPPLQCGHLSRISRRSSLPRVAVGRDGAASPSLTMSPAAADGPSRDSGWDSGNGGVLESHPASVPARL